jgi:peptidoglycan/LPS O-acetylase OafA/YrhL
MTRAGHDAHRVRELDGLRAVAVIPVIALHFGASVNGGAGVTVFFALSGFLISSLLMDERAATGRIDLRTFYVRRFRRLLPAATLVVIVTVLVGRLMDKPPIFRDALASLIYWENFARYTSHYTYGQTAYAPLEHFWSLAIEEQFYMVLPLLCIVLLRSGRRVVGLVAALGAAASAWFAWAGRDRPSMYFHSLARVGELLIGVVLAVVLPVALRRFGGRLRRWLPIAGYLALAALLAVFARVLTPQPIFVAALACVVVAGRPRVLGWTPLVRIGVYSYGLYLWHPLTAVITHVLAVRLLLTVVLTVLSFHLVEFPVRRRLSVPRALTAMAVLSTVAFVVIALPQPSSPVRFLPTAPVVAAAGEPAPDVAASSAPETPSVVDAVSATAAPVSTPSTSPASEAATTAAAPEESAAGAISRATGLPQTVPPTTVAPTTVPPTTVPAPLRISGAGDSTQMFADAAWQAFAAAYPDRVTWVTPPPDVVPWTSGADGWGGAAAAELGLSLPHDGPQGGLDRQGCPMLYDLPIRAVDNLDFTDSKNMHSATPELSCDWHRWLPRALAEMDLDVLVVSWTVTDMWEYELDGRQVAVGDPGFDALLDRSRAELEAMAAAFGTKVVWTTYQPLSTDDVPARWTSTESADAAADVLFRRPCVADLRAMVRADPAFPWYQDGYHFTPDGAARAVAAIVPVAESCARR